MGGGSRDPAADRLSGQLPYAACRVEWDAPRRDGGFELIRSLRAGALMVMGIVSTKSPAMETQDALLAQMDEAAKIAGGLDRLAISPQCGFASVVIGNRIDEDVQWR